MLPQKHLNKLYIHYIYKPNDSSNFFFITSPSNPDPHSPIPAPINGMCVLYYGRQVLKVANKCALIGKKRHALSFYH